MAMRKGDDTPAPAGGRAAERLRQFENSRRPQVERLEKGEAEPEEPREQQAGQALDQSDADSEDQKAGGPPEDA